MRISLIRGGIGNVASFAGGRAVGALCGVLAAVCYGANPLGAVSLYRLGYSTGSVLLYRFGLAALLLMAFVVIRRVPLWPKRGDWSVVLSLGLLFAVSSLTFYDSFRVLDVGVACTLLFVYPILTAIIMAVFFRERLTVATVVSTILAIAGIACLSLGGGGAHRVSAFGLLLVGVSALTYAVYIVVVNRSRITLKVSAMTFWVLSFCWMGIAVWSLFADGASAFRLPQGTVAWTNAFFLAVVPTLLSLILMTYSSRLLGATPTAILGALEPLTAVAIGVLALNEAFTLRLAAGLMLVLSAVVVVLVRQRPSS